MHPGVLGGRGIETHRTYLKAKRRLVEQPGDEDDRCESDEETSVQTGVRAEEVRQGSGRQNGRGTIHTGSWVTQHLLDEVIHQLYGNVVHHDGVDDLVGTASSFEDSRNSAPHGPAKCTGR